MTTRARPREEPRGSRRFRPSGLVGPPVVRARKYYGSGSLEIDAVDESKIVAAKILGRGLPLRARR